MGGSSDVTITPPRLVAVRGLAGENLTVRDGGRGASMTPKGSQGRGKGKGKGKGKGRGKGSERARGFTRSRDHPGRQKQGSATGALTVAIAAGTLDATQR